VKNVWEQTFEEIKLSQKKPHLKAAPASYSLPHKEQSVQPWRAFSYGSSLCPSGTDGNAHRSTIGIVDNRRKDVSYPKEVPFRECRGGTF
jgi:hypothetical protein